MTDNRIRSNSALRNSLTQKHPSSPNRKALSRDTWNQTDVWVLSSSSDQWKAGTCVSHAAVEDASTAAAVTAWRFTVELAKGVRVEIEAHSIDDSCSEFDAVKRRDDAMAGLNVADMTCLSYLNEPEMLECLRRRYAAKQIYTNTGPILLAINPFQSLPLYSEEVLLASINADLTDAAKLGPHVYQVAKRAYTQMLVDKFNPDVRENQSILVSGESGAGKTESTKHLLHYLAVLSCQIADRLGVTCDGGDFESLITAAIPITESFGNATTSRNNNSSRFAKFIELLYTADGYVDGAVISTYLLETVRVVHQSSGERNFHVFYELFAGLTAAQRNEWRFPSLESFMYTNQSNTYTRHDGVEDKENFVKLEDAMNKMNITDFEQEDIFKLLISILHMGNIRFKESDMMGDEGAVFDNASVEHVECVCEFTGLQQDALLKAMTKRGLTVAGTEVHKSLNVTAAAVSRDAMAQHLYELIFTSMIRDINTTIALEDSSVMASFIGILDISGFEHFKTNSFEQLCINYSNEKLQSHFNFSVFVSEREVYLQEGLVWSCDSYPDNSAMLDLFENKSNGIFSLCDEQLKMPRPTDEQLYSSLVAKCSSNKFFDTNKSGKVKKEFMVIHFAVDVIYDTTGFLAKNRNEIASDVVNSFASSVLPILEKIRGVPNQRSALLRRALSSFQSAPTKATAIVNKKTVTLASQFIKNLQNLMSKIRTTRSHFIRCIKPNASLVANSFDCLMIMKQLRSGGALDTLRVFKTGFSNRMDFQVFSTRYALFLTICGFNTLTRGFVDFIKLARQTGSARHWKSAAHHLIDIIPITCLILNWLFYGEHERSCGTSFNAADVRNGLHVGRTQIFCRAQMFEYLELLRKMALEHVVQSLQRRRKARILSGAPCDKSLQRALLATHAVIYFSDFRQRKARKHVCATFIIQRRYRVYRAVSRRKLSLWSVVQIHCIVRRFLARLHVKRLKCLLVIRRRAQARRIQRIWKVHHRTVKVTAAAKVDAADQLKDKAAQIALLTNDIDRLQACQKELLRENEVLRERIETLTATTSTLTTTSPEELTAEPDDVSHSVRMIRRRGSDRCSTETPLSAAVTEFMRLRSSEVVFIIAVQLKSYDWNAVRSFADFCALRKKLSAMIPPEVDTLFPPSVFYLLRLSDEEAESRRCWLDRYMNRLAQSLDISTNARAFELLMDFFGADEIGVEGRVHGKLSVST